MERACGSDRRWPIFRVVSKIITEAAIPFFDELDTRVRQLERFTSKESKIVDNPPIDWRDKRKILGEAIHFWTNILESKFRVIV